MEIRIGIINSGRELSFESNASAATLQQQIADVLDAKATHLTLSDVKGTAYIIPTANLGYVELGSEESRRVGFVA